MSSVATVPPPNSSSLMRRLPRLTARARRLLTAVNLHFAGVTALAVLNLYLVAHLLYLGQEIASRNMAAMNAQRVTLRAAEIAAEPLRGLDEKLAQSTEQANQFYAQRFPYAYSQVAAELGSLTGKAGVRLTSVVYAQDQVLSGSDALTAVNMDARVSGDYRPIVQFLNAVERDRMFFVIRGINLTGQQTGQVNLRIRLTTFLRAPEGNEAAAPLPSAANVESNGEGAER